MIADPPVPPEATEIVAALKPAVTAEMLGVFGAFAGIIEAEGVDVSETPTPFMAVITNV